LLQEFVTKSLTFRFEQTLLYIIGVVVHSETFG
jgi:hypothetical protein